MNEEDKKLQKQLVDEMMKVYETNPVVIFYMHSLMENYEKLEQENKQLKEDEKKVIEYIKRESFYDESGKEVMDMPEKLLKILEDKK